MTERDNPWKKIKEESIIAAKGDYCHLINLLNSENYKKKLKGNSDKNKDKDNKKNNKEDKDIELKLNFYPQHFVGDIENSKIIILGLNPGYKKEYADKYDDVLGKKIRRNLEAPSEIECFYAFYDPTEYWVKKLDTWIAHIRAEGDFTNQKELDEYFTKMVSIIEFFPYHSKNYDEIFNKIADGEYLPTQRFVFDIIRDRINDEKDDVVIIISRSVTRWQTAIPGLKNYENCFELSSPQRTSYKFESINRVTRENKGGVIKKILTSEKQSKSE